MKDIDLCREKFEEISAPNFGVDAEFSYRIRRSPNGCYNDPILEDHWNTFQEGWEAFSENSTTAKLAKRDITGYVEILKSVNNDWWNSSYAEHMIAAREEIKQLREYVTELETALNNLHKL